ncbi:MAG: DNA translocase FtsK, partial [Leuconostoc falkenbergense]
LFQDALQFVIEQQKASTSLLQRRFRIGYNRAARLIDDLEASGYIGPADGSRPRHVNVSDGSSGIEQ